MKVTGVFSVAVNNLAPEQIKVFQELRQMPFTRDVAIRATLWCIPTYDYVWGRYQTFLTEYLANKKVVPSDIEDVAHFGRKSDFFLDTRHKVILLSPAALPIFLGQSKEKLAGVAWRKNSYMLGDVTIPATTYYEAHGIAYELYPYLSNLWDPLTRASSNLAEREPSYLSDSTANVNQYQVRGRINIHDIFRVIEGMAPARGISKEEIDTVKSLSSNTLMK